MTIENSFDRVASSLERIASVMESVFKRNTVNAESTVFPTATATSQTAAEHPASSVAESAKGKNQDPIALPEPAKKRGRPSKETTAAATQTDAFESEQPAAKKLTLQDVRGALLSLQGRSTAAEATKVIKSFGVASLSSLPEDKYKAVIDKANATLVE